MSLELIYTSVPSGLKPNTSGFCTAAATGGMSRQVMMKLEPLSRYDFVYSLSDSRADHNPINFCHTTVQLSGNTSVLSRVAFAGADYSARANKIAHHVLLNPQERCPQGPAWMLQQLDDGVFSRKWDQDARDLEPRSVAAPLAGKPPSDAKPAARWQEITGDAGWAGMLVKAFRENPKVPAYVVYKPGVDILALFAESLALLPPDQRWAVCFATYYTGMPPGSPCHWRAVVAGSEHAAEAAKFPNAVVINLTQPLDQAPDNPYTQAAREGITVGAPAVPASAMAVIQPTPDSRGISPVRPIHQDPEAENQEPVDLSLVAPRGMVARKPRQNTLTIVSLAIAALLLLTVGVLFALLRQARQELDHAQGEIQRLNSLTRPAATRARDERDDELAAEEEYKKRLAEQAAQAQERQAENAARVAAAEQRAAEQAAKEAEEKRQAKLAAEQKKEAGKAIADKPSLSQPAPPIKTTTIAKEFAPFTHAQAVSAERIPMTTGPGQPNVFTAQLPRSGGQWEVVDYPPSAKQYLRLTAGKEHGEFEANEARFGGGNLVRWSFVGDSLSATVEPRAMAKSNGLSPKHVHLQIRDREHKKMYQYSLGPPSVTALKFALGFDGKTPIPPCKIPLQYPWPNMLSPHFPASATPEFKKLRFMEQMPFSVSLKQLTVPFAFSSSVKTEGHIECSMVIEPLLITRFSEQMTSRESEIASIPSQIAAIRGTISNNNGRFDTAKNEINNDSRLKPPQRNNKIQALRQELDRVNSKLNSEISALERTRAAHQEKLKEDRDSMQMIADLLKQNSPITVVDCWGNRVAELAFEYRVRQ